MRLHYSFNIFHTSGNPETGCNAVVKKRKETPAVEVTLVGEDDVLANKFLPSAGSPSKRNTVKGP